jgi:hypothetical protein
MFTTTQRESARRFLKVSQAKEISTTETDTFKRTVYEIDMAKDGKTEVWIERESKLEEPEYFYNLFQFKCES